MGRRVLPTLSSLRADIPPPGGEGERWRMILRRLFPGGWGGRGAAGPRPVLLCCYRFDEADLPRAAVFHAPSGWRPLLRALPDHRRRHCWLRRAADMTACVGGPHRKRAASRRTPSIDVLKDPRSIHSPGFIARPQPAAIEERGSDALPTDGMGSSLGGGLPMAGRGRCDFLLASEVSGLAARDMLTIGEWVAGFLILLPMGEGGRRSRSDEGRMVEAARPPRDSRPSPLSARTPAAPPCAQALSQWERDACLRRPLCHCPPSHPGSPP